MKLQLALRVCSSLCSICVRGFLWWDFFLAMNTGIQELPARSLACDWGGLGQVTYSTEARSVPVQ